MVMQRAIHPLDGSYTILGERRPMQYGHTCEVRSPVDGGVVGAVHEYTDEEVDAIVARCAADQPAWGELSVGERTDTLRRFADELTAHADDLAELLVMEIAKARVEARDEIARSADLVRLAAEEAARVLAGAPRPPGTGLALSRRVPVGAVLAITPFHHPVELAVGKVTPALAAGNAVVLKPATQGSLAVTVMGELLARAGAPASAFQVVTGRGSVVGARLVRHPGVGMITFTGSTEIGREIARGAPTVPLVLELAGKDAGIVLADADLEAAAEQIVRAAFAYGGQRCTAVKRVLCVEAVADELVGLLAGRIERLSVGDPRRDAQVTPLVDPASADRAVAMVDQAVRMGAVVLCGGGRRDNLLEPVLLDHVTEHMDVAWVEPLAPVLPVLRVPHAAAAVELANRGEYGQQAAVFGRDVDLAMQVALRLDVGTVQINGRTTRAPEHFPFVGARSSGSGAEGARQAVEAMTRVRTVLVSTREHDLTEIR